MTMEKICLVGSGNWGSAIAKVIGENTKSHEQFDDIVHMYVYEEVLPDGRKLTEVINREHENVKYLPGVKLPENVVAVPDLKEAAANATVLIFVVPHQFVKRLCGQLAGHLAPGARAISLIKGIETGKGFQKVSDVIRENLNVDVSALMGANIANEVAREMFCETTIGCAKESDGVMYKALFDRPYFRVRVVEDVAAVELCGALKNIVALGAGFVDGMDLGTNTKSAIMRIGLVEMVKFIRLFEPEVKDSTFLESCGVADLITTCFGGRNRKCAEAFVRSGKSFEELEASMLDGQKLQGTETAIDAVKVIREHKLEKEFPMFMTIHDISFHGRNPSEILNLDL